MNTKNMDVNEKKEYLKFQREKFWHRRAMTWITLISYLVISVYMLVSVPFEHFEHYTAYMTQLSMFAGAVIGYYYASSTWSEVGQDNASLVEEYKALSRRNMPPPRDLGPRQSSARAYPEDDNSEG